MNSFWNKIFFFLMLLLTGNLFSQETDAELEKRLDEEHRAREEYSTYINEVEEAFSEQMKKELNIYWSGINDTRHAKIEDLGMQFVAKRRATIEEARALHLFIINKFVQAVNVHEKIQPFLEVQPFSYRRAHISLSFRDANSHKTFSDGTVTHMYNITENAGAENNRNKLIYYSSDPCLEYNTQLLKETYEEALVRAEASGVKDLAVHARNEQEEIMDRLFASFTKEIEKEVGLRCYGIGGQLVNGVEEISARFDVFNTADQNQARQLLLQVSERLLKLVNSQENLKPYLKEYPFPSNRIKIRIEFKDRRGGYYRDISMKEVTLNNNEIIYVKAFNHPEEKLLDIFEDSTESYEEALQQMENPPKSIWKYTSVLGLLTSFSFRDFFDIIFYYFYYVFVALYYIGSYIRT